LLTSVCGVAATYFFLILSFVLGVSWFILLQAAAGSLSMDSVYCPARLRCRTCPDDKKLAGQLSDFRSFHAKP
jgi:hypothetical protein